MIKAVAFDLWETLISDTPTVSSRQEEARLTRMAASLRREGFDVSSTEVEQAYRQLWSRCFELYWAKDLDIHANQQILHFLEALDLDPAAVGQTLLGELELAYAGAAIEHPPELVPNARETLAKVRQRNLKTGLVSNTGRTPGSALREVLASHGLSGELDVLVFSNEHGQCKPRPSIFEKLREGLALRFDEILFVGDNLYADVHGAQSCGMLAVHFTPATRGNAVAPPVDHGLDIVPHATIERLEDLDPILAELTG
ncbi:MAG TPA: HAD family hydrolase [Thermoanaerobaculia bacterium]|nr:HAD family hydrolase [Thermoanaerobaculia bacterium]